MTPSLFNALEYAAVAHDGQKRKDNFTPYIVHPFAVGMILLQYGFSEEVVIAGILHDVVEDTIYSLTDIQEKFGEKISHIIDGVTENKKIISQKERFEYYLALLENSDNDVKAVRAADMLHNRKSVLKELNNKFDIWNALHTTKEDYLEDSYLKFNIIKKTLKSELVNELEGVLNDIKNY